MLVLGHRGAPDMQFENTIASFDAAIRLGADGVELDVRRTRDGHLVVHHDPRIPGAALPIERLSLSEVKARRLPSRDRIPTLDEALARLGHAAVVVELKGRASARELGRLLERQPSRPGLRISSFNHKMLAQLTGKRYPLALTIDRLEPDTLRKAARMGATELHIRHTLIDASLVSKAHRMNLAVLAWTVDRPEDFARMRELEVDGVITNKVERALQYFQKKKTPRTRGTA